MIEPTEQTEIPTPNPEEQEYATGTCKCLKSSNSLMIRIPTHIIKYLNLTPQNHIRIKIQKINTPPKKTNNPTGIQNLQHKGRPKKEPQNNQTPTILTNPPIYTITT